MRMAKGVLFSFACLAQLEVTREVVRQLVSLQCSGLVIVVFG